MADKKTGKGVKPTAPAPEEEDQTETIYTLPELGARLGAATQAEVDSYTAGMAKADLIQTGAEVATRRIDKDSARLYGIAADFFDKADEDQLDGLLGVSKDMLRVAIWAANEGSGRAESRGKGVQKAGTSKQVRVDQAASLRDKALARRKALRAGLRALAGGQQPVLGAIEVAYGTISSPKAIGDALDALVKIGRSMLTDGNASQKARLAGSRLTKAYLDATAELAKDVREKGEVASAVAGVTGVSQTEVDYWDGINLYFLSTFVDVFEAGNDVDPTIPRLVPISFANGSVPPAPRAATPGHRLPAPPTAEHLLRSPSLALLPAPSSFYFFPFFPTTFAQAARPAVPGTAALFGGTAAQPSFSGTAALFGGTAALFGGTAALFRAVAALSGGTAAPSGGAQLFRGAILEQYQMDSPWFAHFARAGSRFSPRRCEGSSYARAEPAPMPSGRSDRAASPRRYFRWPM